MEDQWALIRWRGAVKQSLRGSRGQAFIREAISALDAMPVKALAKNTLQTEEGSYCTLGAVGAARGMDLSTLDPEDTATVAAQFGISGAMAREIVYMNDEGYWQRETPEARWARMREWLEGWARKDDAP
jgi:hypothetical protein